MAKLYSECDCSLDPSDVTVENLEDVGSEFRALIERAQDLMLAAAKVLREKYAEPDAPEDVRDQALALSIAANEAGRAARSLIQTAIGGYPVAKLIDFDEALIGLRAIVPGSASAPAGDIGDGDGDGEMTAAIGGDA